MNSIPHYRLTKEIIERELLKMFPAMSREALGIKVSDHVNFKSQRWMLIELQ